MELVNIFSVEFGFPVADKFTLEIFFRKYKLNSMELAENIFPVEFGFPGVDEFTLEFYLHCRLHVSPMHLFGSSFQ